MSKTSLSRLQTFFGHLQAEELLNVMINDEFKDKIVLVSSFGSGSALLLDMVAKVNPDTRVLFLETRKHFPETLQYVESLQKNLGLTNVKLLYPEEEKISTIDKEGNLWQHNPSRCCYIRKVLPLQKELDSANYQALITGRKRYQTKQRENMETIELHEDGRFRINPLAYFTAEQVKAEFQSRNLPEHPLVEKGYLSIGCAPCTLPVKEGDDPRSGRWAHTARLPGGEQKTECGIHLSNTKPEWNI